MQYSRFHFWLGVVSMLLNSLALGLFLRIGMTRYDAAWCGLLGFMVGSQLWITAGRVRALEGRHNG